MGGRLGLGFILVVFITKFQLLYPSAYVSREKERTYMLTWHYLDVMEILYVFLCKDVYSICKQRRLKKHIKKNCVSAMDVYSIYVDGIEIKLKGCLSMFVFLFSSEIIYGK